MVALLALPLIASAQPAPSGSQAGTRNPEFRTWSSPDLHLTYWYPAELTQRDGAFAAAAGRRVLYGENAEDDQGKADTCTKVLFSVGKGSETGQGSWARLGVVDLSGQCFPPKILHNKKATRLLLRSLVKQGTTLMGTMPLEVPTLYELQGRPAGFCAAEGQPLTASDLQTAGQELIGIAAVAAEDRILAWVIETNDSAVFNRILGSGVDLGTGKPDKLFPAEVR